LTSKGCTTVNHGGKLQPRDTPQNPQSACFRLSIQYRDMATLQPSTPAWVFSLTTRAFAKKWPPKDAPPLA
jgi:hypothetical protein